jgi:hypothetical protein
VNIIFCIEGTEQNGSLGFDEFIHQYADELKAADAVWSPGTYRQDQGGKTKYTPRLQREYIS